MKNSTIGVYLTDDELIIIARWINYVRDVSLDRKWSEEENDLAEKFNQHSKWIYEINS